MEGLWEVTALNTEVRHPFRLFQGVVRKYDARLRHEGKKYTTIVKNEQKYCRKFFAGHRFKEKQIRAILDYKDAYSLKEVQPICSISRSIMFRDF